MKFKDTLNKFLLKVGLKKEDTFCPLLFQHLATNPNGWPSYCCFVEHSLPDSFSIDKDKTKQKTVKNYEFGKDIFVMLNVEPVVRGQVLNGLQKIITYKNKDWEYTLTVKNLITIGQSLRNFGMIY
jgi:hypothetical protein